MMLHHEVDSAQHSDSGPMIEGGEIKARAAAIRLHGKELAKAAPCSLTTVYNLFRGDAGRTDTLKRIGSALVAEELRLRDHLLALHPLEGAAQ